MFGHEDASLVPIFFGKQKHINMIKLEIECPKCKKNISCDINESYLVEDQRKERDMGTEVEYSVSQPVQCSRCKSNLDVNIFEYPEGVYTAVANISTL